MIPGLINNIFRIGRSQYGAGARLGPRDTIGFEFVRILTGHIEWTYDGEVFYLKPGDWILSQPDHVEHFNWDKKGETEHDHIHFTLTENQDVLPDPVCWPKVLRFDADHIMHHLFEHIISLHQSAHDKRVELMKLSVQQMLYLWVYQVNQLENLPQQSFSACVKKVINLYQKQWHQGDLKPLSTEEMVAVSGKSRSSFLRAFIAQCQYPPNRFFEYQRLHQGRLLLLESNKTIEQISDLLGYNSQFHFSKNFKKLFKLSPSEFRHSAQREQIQISDYTFQRVFTILSSTQRL